MKYLRNSETVIGMILLLIWFGAAAAVGMAWNSWQEARRSRPVTFNRRFFRSSKRHALR